MGPRRAALPALLFAAAIALLTSAAASAVAAPGPASSPAKPATAAAPSAPAASTSACTTLNLLAGKKPHLTADVRGDVALITDGTVAHDGAAWDAPAAVTWDVPSASVTYDLGEPRPVSALFVQADANDTYKILGSLDGTPASYRVIADVANVVERGHGLRNRAIEIMPATVRYLRIGDGNGDGLFSLSELAAYCDRPTPFPPVMRTVDGMPAAPSDGAAAGRNVGAGPPPDSGRGVLLWMAGLLAVAWIAYSAVSRRSARAATPAAIGGDAESPAVDAKLPLHDVLRVLFLASGCAALIYEVVWFHLLRLVIGASALSVGIVLASFMGGMFLGSLLFARYVPADKNPVRVYAWLEIGIGVFGVLMPILLPAVRFIYIGLVGYGPLGIAMRAVIAAVLLLPPTALMGATLPAIARLYARGRRGMSSLGGLYAANTIGAVLGSLLSAFVLLAFFDVWVATLTAAAVNGVIGLVALRRSRSAEAVPAPIEPPPAHLSRPARDPRPIYIAACLSGLTALGAQVVWTRLLTLLFGATVYAFAIILAVFLAGLGIGSAAASQLIRRGNDPMRSLIWTQLALIPALLLGGFLLAQALPYASPPAWTPVAALHALHVVRAVNVILPGAICWGMSFPFALAAAAAAGGDTGRSSGFVYAANTVGAIAGAILISFVIIPAFGTQSAQRCLVLGAALSAAIPLIWLRRAGAAQPLVSGRRSLSPLSPLVIGAFAAAVLPAVPTMFQTHGRYIWWIDAGDKYPFVAEGAASTVGVHIAPSGYSNFHVSGRVESTNNPNDLRLVRLLGHLSALSHPKPESALVVGLGAGITAGALLLYPEMKRIVICEIEPEVVGAAKLFEKENYKVLSDPRVQVVFDDARHFLATTREKFDIVTSDPIHPWVRGNSILFSREYYGIVKNRLTPNGIATQWVPLYETSETAIKIQMKTFMDAFPDGTVWSSAANNKGYDVVLLASNAPLRFDVMDIQRRIDANPRVAQSMRDVKLNGVVDLLATYGASGRDMTKWLADSPVNRDFSLKLEYISGLALNNKEADTIYANMTADHAYPQNIIIAPPPLQAELVRRIGGHLGH